MKDKKIVIITSVFIIGLLISSIFLYRYYTKDLDLTRIKTYKLTDLPKIDASLATQPLADALYANFTGKNVKDINIEYTNTHPAYIKLIDGDVDLIIVTDPSEEELNYAKEKNVELEFIPIVNEAFVFFVNKENKIDNLQISDIQKIYSGKINNWKELGGDEAKILAYQRPENSGSQTGMLSLVMKDIKMKIPLKEELEETMLGIIEVVADYKNANNAIGYSYYYFANTMYGNDNIKFLGIDGVKPTYETIQNKSYPLMSSYYIVINKKEPENSIVREIVKLMLDERGQNIAKDTGYISIKNN